MKASTYWMPILFVAVIATPAWSADLEVKYKVDARNFKSNVVAGVTITFEIYSDAGCTVLEDSVGVLAEDIDSVEQPKLKRVRSGPKPPKAYWLREVLPGISPTAESYVIASSPGVTPIGPECQAQSAAVNVGTGVPDTPLRSAGVSFSRTALEGSGLQTITGIPFQPTTVLALCGPLANIGPDLAGSIGMMDETNTSTRILISSVDGVLTNSGNLVGVGIDGIGAMNATAFATADGFTLTWSKSGAGMDVACVATAFR